MLSHAEMAFLMLAFPERPVLVSLKEQKMDFTHDWRSSEADAQHAD